MAPRSTKPTENASERSQESVSRSYREIFDSTEAIRGGLRYRQDGARETWDGTGLRSVALRSISRHKGAWLVGNAVKEMTTMRGDHVADNALLKIDATTLWRGTRELGR